ncbi:hypothetical protein [Burkholderia ubonensis]|nr:hypothetical protein [Burkholderia ubonensis]
MECLIASTTSRIKGGWLFTGHVRSPLHPGVRYIFRGQTFLIADDLSLKVRFPAQDHEEARDISREIARELNSLGEPIARSRRDTVANLSTVLRRCDSAVIRACEASFLGHMAGSSTFAAYIIARHIKNALPQLRTTVRAGDGAATGYIEANGVTHAHAWVEVSDGTEPWVVDIMADQYGGDAVTIMPLSVASRCYVPANDDFAQKLLSTFESRIIAAIPADETVAPSRRAESLLDALLAAA